MTLSLRQRILWWSVASTLLIMLPAFLLVDEIIGSTIERDERENVIAAARLLVELQGSEVDELLDRTAGIAAAPTLRAAVETADPPTIRENLDALLRGAGMDWLAVTTPDGALLAATDGAPPLDRAASLVESARFFDSAELLHDGGRLVQLHGSGIFFGSTQLGVVLGGVAIDAERVERMETATRQRVAFLGPGMVFAADPELTDALRPDLIAAWDTASSDADALEGDVREFTLAGERYIGSAIPLPDGRGGTVGRLVTFRSLEAAMAPARFVRYALLGIAAVGLLFAFAASYVLARRVSAPVSRLLDETVRLGSGDLDHPVAPERDIEMGRLSLGFEQMRRSLRSAQQELVRAERLSAVGRAASAIVHDIKQPVTVIQGHVGLLEQNWDDDSTRAEDFQTIRHQLRRLDGMMREVLDFASGTESMHPTSGSVRELLDYIEKSVRPLLRDSPVSLDVEHGYDGNWTLDFPRTQRLLENLVRNAVAALKDRGGSVVLRSHANGKGLRLEVADDGPGIPEAIRDNLFEPFVTHGKKEGTGLGLAIVKAFAERQGGTVRYETSSSGTRFIVDFPAGVVA
ncbi:MAG: ATP-binding protein [Longimicrobiales bacterium]